jgi:drug/metabolite transporter (DMT)-like permease
LWFFCAIGGAISFGIHNIFINIVSQKRGMGTPLVSCFGNIFVCLLRKLNGVADGEGFSWSDWGAIWPNAIFGVIVDILVALTFKFSFGEGVNVGFLSTIFSLSSVSSTFLFWIFQNQKPKKFTWVYIGAILVSVYLMNNGG